MKRALLVIDVQNEYFTGALPVVKSEVSLPNILIAINKAHKNDIPVIAIQHTNTMKSADTYVKFSNSWELHSSIIQAGYSTLIEKNFPGSFTNTNLEKYLKHHHIDTVTICGYMTHMCCDTTSRQAFHLGYNVEFLSDATGTINLKTKNYNISANDLHNSILAIQESLFSKVLTTDEWINSI